MKIFGGILLVTFFVSTISKVAATDTLLNIVRIRNANDSMYMTMEIGANYTSVPVLSQQWQNLTTQMFEHILETTPIIGAKNWVFRPLSAPGYSLLTSYSVGNENLIQPITQFPDNTDSSRRYRNQRFTETIIGDGNYELKQSYDCGIYCRYTCVSSFGEGRKVEGAPCDRTQTDLSQQWIIEPLNN